MDCYTNLKEATQDKELNTAAKTGYDTALKDLSLDTGADGSQVISETKTLACQGDRATSPAVDLEKKEPGKALSCDSKIALPGDLEPVDPGHFRYVVKVETGTDTIQTCPYSASGQPGIAVAHILRQVQWLKVSLVRTTTGTVWAERKFTGDKPERCPSTYTFLVTSTTEYFTGTEPDISKIIEWLKKAIK
jgi:hypothetical protein